MKIACLVYYCVTRIRLVLRKNTAGAWTQLARRCPCNRACVSYRKDRLPFWGKQHMGVGQYSGVERSAVARTSGTSQLRKVACSGPLGGHAWSPQAHDHLVKGGKMDGCMDGRVDGWMKRLGARRHRCHPRVIGTPMRCCHARHARQPRHKAGRRKPMSADAQADAGYPSKTSLSPTPWPMSSLKASWVAGHVRSAATYMAHVCACGLGGKLLRCVWNTSGTGLERGLERLREWLALWNASKPHVNMVVSTM